MFPVELRAWFIYLEGWGKRWKGTPRTSRRLSQRANPLVAVDLSFIGKMIEEGQDLDGEDNGLEVTAVEIIKGLST